MKKLGKWLLVLMMCVALCMGLCACGEKTASEDEYEDGDTIEIVLWATYGARGQAYLDRLVKEFNSSQDDYFVQVFKNGSATEIRTKLEAASKENYPSLFCGVPLNISTYVGAKYIKPIYEFFEEDEEWKEWTYDNVYPNVIQSYCDKDGNMLGWPLGVSCSGYFVNVDALKKAGYSLEDMTSYEKIAEAATAIKQQNLCKYGIIFHGNGVEGTDMLTIQGLSFFNNNNGYSKPATEVVMGEGENRQGLKKMVNITAQLYKDKVAAPFEMDLSTEGFPLFDSGEAGFVYATNSWTHYVTYGEPEFEYAFIPSVGIDDNAKFAGSVISEGTGLFVADTGNEREMKGACEFLKFLSQPENQAQWCSTLGYVPYTDEAVATEAWQNWMAETLPSAQNVIDKIKSSDANIRLPYAEFAVNSVGAGVFSELSADATVDPEELIDAALYSTKETLELWKTRR